MAVINITTEHHLSSTVDIMLLSAIIDMLTNDAMENPRVETCILMSAFGESIDLAAAVIITIVSCLGEGELPQDH